MVVAAKVSVQNVFADLLDSLILDVASEAHRAARLGFDYRLRNEEEDEARTCTHRVTPGDVDAAAAENSGKYTVDVFDQTHPAIAQEMFDCMNCGRPIAAGRFAPHLEKCMGKGRKARLKPILSVSASQPRRGRAAVPVTNNNAVRPSSKPPVRALPAPPPAPLPQDAHRLEVNGASSTPAGSPEADKEDDVVAGPSHLGKARTKKTSLKLQRVNPGGGAIKGRKVSEKKRKIGQVMAGSAPSVSNGGGSMENGLSLPQLDASPKPVDIMNNYNNNNNSLDAPVPLPSFSSPSSWNRSPT